MKPRELTKKEKEKLQDQFPHIKAEVERLKKNKEERIKNKIEICLIVFFLIALIGVLYLFYLSWNYRFVGL